MKTPRKDQEIMFTVLSDTFSKSGPLRFGSEKSLPSNFAQ